MPDLTDVDPEVEAVATALGADVLVGDVIAFLRFDAGGCLSGADVFDGARSVST